MNERRKGSGMLRGRPLDDNGAIEFAAPAPQPPSGGDALQLILNAWKWAADTLEELRGLEPLEQLNVNRVVADYRQKHTQVTNALAAHDTAVRAATEAERQLWRRLLWLNHSRYMPGNHIPYGDDGEMQCCGIDFKRWTAQQIDEFLTERALRAAAP